MPLQIWRFIKMPLQFPNFEKCHCNFCKLWKMPLKFANSEKHHSRLQKMPLEMAWNGIFQSLEIAMAFLRNTRFGVAFIKLTQNKNNWASCWVPDVSRSLCNSLVYWLRWQWHGTQMSEIHYEEPFFYWLEIRRHLLAYCHDLGGSLLSSSPRTIISWLCTRQLGRPTSQPLNPWRTNTTHLKK